MYEYLQGGGNKANEVANNTSSESKDHSVASARILEQEVLDLRLSFATFAGLTRWDNMSQETSGIIRRSSQSVGKRRFKRSKVESSYTSVGDEHIGRRRKVGEDSLGNVRRQMETAVNGVFSEDGDLSQIGLLNIGSGHGVSRVKYGGECESSPI